MHLGDAEALREELGFDDMQDINDAISAAMNLATEVLSARIGTDVDHATVTDLFRVPRNANANFKLSRGFVDTDTVQLETFPTLEAAHEVGGVTAYESHPYVKGEEGTVLVPGLTPGTFLRATYEAGFEVDASYVDRYDLEVVPQWLQDAAKAQAQLLLATSVLFQDSGNAALADPKMLAR